MFDQDIQQLSSINLIIRRVVMTYLRVLPRGSSELIKPDLQTNSCYSEELNGVLSKGRKDKK